MSAESLASIRPPPTQEPRERGEPRVLPTTAVVLAAGLGTRIHDGPKPLARVAGLSLLERVVLGLREAGVQRIIVVIGHEADDLRRFASERGLDVEFVENPGYRRGNASSVLLGGRTAGGRFLLAMVDHVFDPDLASRVLASRAQFAAAVDTKPRFTGLGEATKVRMSDGRVVELARELPSYDALDAGLFLCDPEVMEATKRGLAAGASSWNEIKRLWLAEGRELEAVDLEGGFWIDVDTPRDARQAERSLLARAAGKPWDGPVARHLNRRLSWPLSLLLVRAGVGPTAASLLAFVAALLAATLIALGQHSPALLVTGGLFVQLASILDGVDGEIARATFTRSSRGAFLDSVLDRLADISILIALAVAAGLTASVWAALVAALVGSMLTPYLTTSYQAAFGRPPQPTRIVRGLGRDLRLLLAAISAVVLQPAWGLYAVAVVANAGALVRFESMWRRESASARPTGAPPRRPRFRASAGR